MRLQAWSLRLLCSALLAAALALGAGQACAPPSAPVAPPSPRVAELAMTVLDLDREGAFLRALDFAVVGGSHALGGESFARLLGLPEAQARAVTLVLGEERLVLTAFLVPAARPMQAAARSNDASFQHAAIVVRDIDRAYARLLPLGITRVSPSPQTIPKENPVAGGVRAAYFRDPEGHFLELLAFPEGKGDPRWHLPGDSLFLGIDHSAIVTLDTNRSLVFYRDRLGLRVASESLNEGLEQEALSGIASARVRITSLRGANGPGVELLEYLSPPGGRPPSALRAGDLARWEISIEVPEIDAVVRQVPASGGALVSPGVVDVSPLGLGYRRAAVVLDPDGHALRLVER